MIHGVSSYTLKVLVDALRLKGMPLRDARIALLGFSFDDAHPHAEKTRALLLARGAAVVAIDVPIARRKLDDHTVDALTGADAVVIATEHPVFRAIRPKEFKDIGIDIVIPTATSA